MSDQPDTRISRIPDAMPISRVLRFLVGFVMSLAMLPPLLRASANGRLRVAIAFAGIEGAQSQAGLELRSTSAFTWRRLRLRRPGPRGWKAEDSAARRESAPAAFARP